MHDGFQRPTSSLLFVPTADPTPRHEPAENLVTRLSSCLQAQHGIEFTTSMHALSWTWLDNDPSAPQFHICFPSRPARL